MQWNDSLSAGFTDGTPWLPVAVEYPTANVAIEKQDPASILTLYRNLIALRHGSPALTTGSYRAVALGENVLAYERFEGDERLLVVLNFDGGPKELTLPSWSGGNVLLSTENQPPAPSSPFLLRPDEGVIIGIPTTRTGALHD
jgi:alpha-glucosidase